MSSIASSPTLGAAHHADNSIFRPYPTGLTFHQKFYIFFLQGELLFACVEGSADSQASARASSTLAPTLASPTPVSPVWHYPN